MNCRLFAALASFALALGCGGDLTEVVVVIQSDMGVPDELDEIGIVITDADGAVVRQQEIPLGTDRGEQSLPVSFGVGKRGAGGTGDYENGTLGFTVGVSGQRFRAEVSAMRAAVRIFTTTASTGFTDGESTRLDLFLAARCVVEAVNCDVGLTCGPVGCESDTIDPEDLPPWNE